LLGVERFHRLLLEQSAITPGCRVLEVGCGTGNLAILAKRLYPAAEVIGTDPDLKALARARRKAGRDGLQVAFEPAYAEALPFPDASFDRVLSALMLHHLPRDAKVPALREIRRVLKPGGSLHLADFDHGDQARGLHGFLASLLHGRRGPSAQATVVGLMGEAGLADPREVARVASVMGRVTYFRAARAP
jgi:ubiquinone/menaquinone biosynthesis C-methylase UbiE